MIFFIYLIFLSYMPLNTCETCRRLDIGFVLDASASVNRERWKQMLNFVKEFASRLEYGLDDIRIGVVSYGDKAKLDISLSQEKGLTQFHQAVDQIGYLNQGTNTAAGLHVLRTKLFNIKHGDRPGVPNVGLIITDGESNIEKSDTVPQAEAAKLAGIIIFTVGIGSNINQRELEAIANDPDTQYVYHVRDFQTLLDSVGMITVSTCQTLSVIKELPCYYDIGFVLDSSGSIGRQNWEKLKEFAQNFVGRLKVGRNSTQVGVVTFSTQSQLVINFERFSSATSLQKAISNLGWKNHRTHAAAGLLEANTNLFSYENGDRNDSENVVIVLTDGKVNVNRGRTIIEAEKLRSSRNVRVFSIAIGDEVRMPELTGMANKPNYYHCFIMKDYTQLVARTGFVFDTVCSDDRPSPHKDFSFCRADIAFVLDESGSVGSSNWEMMLQFVGNFTSKIPLGPDANRVGVVKFGSSASLSIRLNQYDNSTDFVDAVRSLSYTTGGTNTAAGLATTIDKLFSVENGDRVNASDIAIVLTDGASNDRNATLAEAERGRAKGITIFAIGIGGHLTRSELQGIANNPDKDFLFYSSDFQTLVSDYGKILGYACFAAASESPLWSCNFEDEENETLCGMQQMTNDQYDWTVGNGSTPSAPTGPTAAHSGNYYIYAEASTPRKLGDEAVLMIPYIIEEEGDYCLTFYRHMFGYHMGALQIFIARTNIGDITVWNLKGEQGLSWVLQHVELHVIKNDQVGIRCIRWNGYAGDMAVDDVKLINGPCPYTSYT